MENVVEETELGNANQGLTELDRNLANYLLSLQVGEQMLTTRELAKRYDASLGSVSTAINNLEEMGTAAINRRGHLGSFLEEKSIKTLWNVAGNGPLVIALTLPSFRRCEGLATALYSLLNGAGAETYLIFMRGSISRINALRSGRCHAVVMSKLAADELSSAKEEIIAQLPPQSFTGEHRVFYRENSNDLSCPWKVGIDPESLDIKYLTELEFADSDVDFVKMTFTQIDLHLEDSPVDAAITTSDFMDRLASKGITSRPLSPKTRAIIGDRASSAAIVINSESLATKMVLQELLKPEEVLAIQQDVLEGRVVPRY